MFLFCPILLLPLLFSSTFNSFKPPARDSIDLIPSGHLHVSLTQSSSDLGLCQVLVQYPLLHSKYLVLLHTLSFQQFSVVVLGFTGFRSLAGISWTLACAPIVPKPSPTSADILSTSFKFSCAPSVLISSESFEL